MKKTAAVIIFTLLVAGAIFGEDYIISTWDEYNDSTGIGNQGVDIQFFNTNFRTLIVYFRIADGAFEILVNMSGDAWEIKNLYVQADDSVPMNCYIREVRPIMDGSKRASIIFGDLTPRGLRIQGESRNPGEYVLNADSLKLRIVYDLRSMPGIDENLNIIFPDEFLQKVKALNWTWIK